jgi:hypothetical protein
MLRYKLKNLILHIKRKVKWYRLKQWIRCKRGRHTWITTGGGYDWQMVCDQCDAIDFMIRNGIPVYLPGEVYDASS